MNGFVGDMETRIAIVTGGSRGIGMAIVEALASYGLTVVFTYLRGEESANEVVDRLCARGERAIAERVDARDRHESSDFVASVIAEFGRLDVLVNNAGITADRLLPSMSDDDWTSVLETSLNGLVGGTRPAARQMMRQRSGRIVNLASVSGLVGIPGQTNYCAAKAAILGFTRSLAKELAPWGVSVNALAPGFVNTDMVAGFSAEQRAANLARVPMRRYGTAEEIGTVARFLALEAPAYLTGQTIVVDGGLIA